MTDAPERIWAIEGVLHGWRDGHCSTIEPSGHLTGIATEYVRADLPPPLSAALALPEVAALVEAAKNVLHDLDHGSGAEGLWQRRNKLRAALAAIREAATRPGKDKP